MVPSCFLQGHIDCCTHVILSLSFSPGAHVCLAGLQSGTHVSVVCLHVSTNWAMLSQRSPHLKAHGSKISPGAQIAVGKRIIFIKTSRFNYKRIVKRQCYVYQEKKRVLLNSRLGNSSHLSWILLVPNQLVIYFSTR